MQVKPKKIHPLAYCLETNEKGSPLRTFFRESGITTSPTVIAVV